MGEAKKFHGMTVVTNHDQTTVKGHLVVEMNSNNDMVCTYYDKEGNAEDDPMIIDILLCTTNHGNKLTEANITGFIKRTVGKNSLLISESAIKVIEAYTN